MKSMSAPIEATEIASPPSQRVGWRFSFDQRPITMCLLVFAGYYLGARVGFALTFQPHPVSVLWPPNSILLAALFLTPPRLWWLVLIAAFPAHCAAQWQSNVPPLMILCWFISNCFEALIGASLTRYFIRGPLRFVSLRNVGIFCLCAAVFAPFISSFLDAAFVRWNHWGVDSYWQLWRIRFSSNLLAVLIVTPLVVTWATGGLAAVRKARRERHLEGVFFSLVSFWLAPRLFTRLARRAIRLCSFSLCRFYFGQPSVSERAARARRSGSSRFPPSGAPPMVMARFLKARPGKWRAPCRCF